MTELFDKVNYRSNHLNEANEVNSKGLYTGRIIKKTIYQNYMNSPVTLKSGRKREWRKGAEKYIEA